jgi:PAS domain S-box-containing protein
MMLDEPVVWNDLTDKEKTLDYVFRHQKVTKINKAMLDQYGATEEQFLGYTPADFFSHDILQGRRIWKDLFDKGHIHEDTYEKKLDGTEIVIEGDYICLYDEENRITGNFGIQRDVTVARRSERALLDNERHLRFITNHLPVSIAHIDNKKQYKFVNQPYAEMLGKHPGDFVGKLIPDVLGEAAFRKAEPFMDMALAGEIAVFEMVLEPAKDEPHTISVYYIPESDNDGKIVGFIASIIDITARKQAEAKIQHQLEELQRWQIVTLGREDRNMELKKEVNELLLSLGQPIRYPSQENRSPRTQTDDLSKNE